MGYGTLWKSVSYGVLQACDKEGAKINLAGTKNVIMQ
jgi:hypothetical protein